MHVNVKIAIYVLAIVLVLAYGTLGSYALGGNNFNVKIGSVSESLYFTVVTISTVGYGDIYPVTTLGRYFTIVLIISGLSIFLSAVTVLSGDFLSARVEKIYRGVSRIEKRWMSNHVVLIGCDSTNLLLAEKLKKQNRNLIIITSDTVMADSLRDSGYHAYAVDYTLKSNMERFRLDRATDVVIDIRDSSKTVYVVLVVRKLAKKVRISAVAQSMEEASHLSDLEIDNIINPASIAADRIGSFIEHSGAPSKK